MGIINIMNKGAIKVISLSIAITASIFVAVFNMTKKKPIAKGDGGELTKYLHLREIIIKKGETFSGVNNDSDCVFHWRCEDMSGWSLESGGYFLLDGRVILPDSCEKSKIIRTGEHFEWIPCKSSDVSCVTNIPEILIKK